MVEKKRRLDILYLLYLKKSLKKITKENGETNFYIFSNVNTKIITASEVLDKIKPLLDKVREDGVKVVLKGVAATKMKARTVAFDKDKMVVLSAGKAYQYSNAFDKKGHRLFSFYIMKNILKGDKSIKKLYKDTKSQTYQTSLEEYGDTRTQEPTVEGNFRLKL
jgi:hypothetical protein